MKAYIINPSITIGQDIVALNFYNTCREELERHIGITTIINEMVMDMTQLASHDIIIFFNRADQNYQDYIISFLQKASENECIIFPIAISEEHRRPSVITSLVQSFDVAEQLQQRKLTSSQIETVAIAFARIVIARLQPTLTRKNMCLFLSYRRSDGEKIAGAFHDELQVRMQHIFRDINAVLVGEEAQEIIETNLRKSDAVIFLDTPKCGESDWIAFELRAALLMHIPIVWIKIGPDFDREKLKIKPADKPHFDKPNIEINTRKVDSQFVDDVIQKAFEISREYAKSILGHMRRIRTLASQGCIKLTELSSENLIYQVQIPRQMFRYFQRPITHLISFYGRIPQEDDSQNFLGNLADLGYKPHPLSGNVYDTALMLAPIALQNPQSLKPNHYLIDSSDEYINTLERYLRTAFQQKPSSKRGVIISGAFPDCEPEHQQHLMDAVHAFTRAILDRNGVVIFGAHPTFQYLIFDMAKQRRPNDYVKSVHLYISKHFVTESAIDEFKKNAMVFPADNIDNDRAKSLTVMRKAMVEDKEAVCMIVMGGKTKRTGIPPGVDEEVRLATAANIPVFYIGSVGGRSAELAQNLDQEVWKEKPNSLPQIFNHQLMVSLDYDYLAKEIMDKMDL